MFELTFFEIGNRENNNTYQIKDISESQINTLREVEKTENRTEIKFKRLYPVICSWCGEILTYGDYEHSHGICSVCASSLEKDILNRKENTK
jgi:formylmethanofuran dehydrogenase subunit E